MFHAEARGSAHAFLQDLAAAAKQSASTQELRSVLSTALQGLPLPKACAGCAAIVSKGTIFFVSIGDFFLFIGKMAPL